MLSAEELLAREKVRVEKFTHPATHEEMFVREMTSDERDEWEVTQYQLNGDKVISNRRQVRARLITKCLCNEKGERVFQDAQLPAVGLLSSVFIDPIHTECLKVNKLRAADTEEAEKKSANGQATSSS